jgi:hypothetical protein
MVAGSSRDRKGRLEVLCKRKHSVKGSGTLKQAPQGWQRKTRQAKKNGDVGYFSRVSGDLSSDWETWE